MRLRSVRFTALHSVIIVVVTTFSLAPPAFAQHDEEHEAAGAAVLNTHVFGNVDLSRQPGEHTSFSLGQLDLFATAQVSERVLFLAETVIEANDQNEYNVDLERLLLAFDINEWLRIGVGRYHTAIGYYNTAYHHGLWFQTAVSRPHVFAFEDDGGVLPVHDVGVTAEGAIPSGRAGLRWVAQTGNGHGPAGAEPVQTAVDADRGKSFNVALTSRPHPLPGFQTGVSFYRDRFNVLPGVSETEEIVAAHAVWIRSPFEWLSEVISMAHRDAGGTRESAPAWYVQGAYQIGRLRPYLRYESLRHLDGLIGSAARISGPSAGLRLELGPSAAIKGQYDHERREGSRQSRVTGQVAFAF